MGKNASDFLRRHAQWVESVKSLKSVASQTTGPSCSKV